MGQALGEVYAELWQEMARLFSKWEEYVELFGTRESRIHLMNDAAADFFGKLQQSGFKEVLLDIACVTDAATIGKRENLSIHTLLDRIPDSALRQRVSQLVDIALAKAAFARDWRNRYLAHRDLGLALGAGKPLSAASRAHVLDALRALGAVLDAVSLHYEDSTTAWEGSAAGGYRGAVSLLYVIDDGVRAKTERTKRLESGHVLPGDYDRDV
jgi:hypothetical protein